MKTEGLFQTSLLIPIIFNSVLGLLDRFLQIVYYFLTHHKWNDFQTENLQRFALTFILLPIIANTFMILLYILFHYEEILTPCVKLKVFILYIISSETLYPVAAHKSFVSKYSKDADRPIITMRVINAIHFIFIAIPQFLVVVVNSSIKGKFNAMDISSLVCSSLFIVWSILYYIYCKMKENDYDEYINLMAQKDKVN